MLLKVISQFNLSNFCAATQDYHFVTIFQMSICAGYLINSFEFDAFTLSDSEKLHE